MHIPYFIHLHHQSQVSGLPIHLRFHLSCYLHKSHIDLSIRTFSTSHGAGQHNRKDFPKIPKIHPPMVSIRVPQHIHAIGIQKLQAETVASALSSLNIFKNLLFFIIISTPTLSLDEILYKLGYYRHKTISCTCQTTFHFYTLYKKSRIERLSLLSCVYAIHNFINSLMIGTITPRRIP